MHKEKETPKGYIKTDKDLTSNKLILQPVYVIPLEIFKTGLLSRPQYVHKLAVVEASGGTVELFPTKKIKIEDKEPPVGVRLPVNIEKGEAVRRALMAAEMEGRGGWRSFLRSVWPSVAEDKVCICWRIWYLDDNQAVDTVTSKKIAGSVWLSIVMSSEKGLVEGN